jgi:hypothetical protein
MLQTENRASAVINVAAAASLAGLAAALVSPSIAAGVASLTVGYRDAANMRLWR